MMITVAHVFTQVHAFAAFLTLVLGMALSDPSIDALNATTLKEIWPRKVIDQFFKKTPFASYLRAKCLSPYRGGAFMQNTHIYAPMIGGAYAPGQNWNMTKRQ